MRRCEDEKMQECEDDVWRCEDVRILCVDVKMRG